MRQIEDDVWKRRGFTLLWSPAALGELCTDTTAIRSLRSLFAMQSSWPDDLPYSDGSALVVTGLEGCLDRMTSDDAAAWLEDDVRPLMHRFQSNYDDAALVFWLPTGDRRVEHVAVDDTFAWKMAPPLQKELFPLSRAIFGGAHTDVGMVVTSDAAGAPGNRSWVGLHLSRLA